MAFSTDGRPLIGQLPCSPAHTYILSGLASEGVARALAAGGLLAELVFSGEGMYESLCFLVRGCEAGMLAHACHLSRGEEGVVSLLLSRGGYAANGRGYFPPVRSCTNVCSRMPPRTYIVYWN